MIVYWRPKEFVVVLAVRLAVMADRKGRSVLFKVPYHSSLRQLKLAIENGINSRILVFQDMGAGEFLVEVEDAEDVKTLFEEGFDVEESHISCHPPHGKFTNVSIMNLRSYIPDEDVKEALKEYGDIKSEVIRLKYKKDHDLAGLENGNRLIKMLLTKPSIPYSLRIGGEWCRVIHDNQQPICSQCHQVGHTRKRCPEVKCVICKEYGHMSYICEKRESVIEVNPDNVKSGDDSTSVEISGKEKSSSKGISVDSEKIAVSGNDVEDMDSEENVQGCKRQHSDSDSGFVTVRRRQRMNPVPNVSCAKPRTEKLLSKKVDNGKTLSDS